MSSTGNLPDYPISERRWFETTLWPVILATAARDSPQAMEAIEKLCRTYWQPLYSYTRRWGYGPEDAQDLTQGFFAKMLQKNFWARANPEKGRFRAFLLTALRQFLADERDRARTLKRGGNLSFISLDEKTNAEHQFIAAVDHNLTGEQQFDRQWAFAVLDQARERLRQECVESGKQNLYDRVNLTGDKNEKSVSYAEISKDLGMSISAVKSSVLRLRQRYGELVREEVSQTVATPAEVDSEIAYLLSVVGR